MPAPDTSNAVLRLSLILIASITLRNIWRAAAAVEKTSDAVQPLALGYLCFVLLRYAWHGNATSNASLPPGPPLAMFGGTKIGGEHPWRTLKGFTDEFGDLITLRTGNGKYLFVCGSATSADAILQKQSGATTDRPHLIMAGDLISGGKRTLVIGQGERWRKYRRVMHESLNTTMAQTYEPMQHKEATITLLSIGRAPDTFQKQFARYAASVIMTLTYDAPVSSIDEQRVQEVGVCLTALGRWMNPSASPLDSWPLLRYVPTPINPWKRLGVQLHQRELKLFLDAYNDVRARTSAGKVRPCFASHLQEKQADLHLTDEEACYVAGSLFGAGSDTTASALSILIMALISHPHVMLKAQQEIDSVIDAGRLPTFDDQHRLPYVSALCQEVHRWRPVSSGGFQHALTEDVQYKSYVLPKGSAIVGNHWSIHMDPNEYPSPDEFRPERFLDDKGAVKGTWFSPKGHIQFGFGRRVCVGSNVAERSVFINAVMLLWAFDIRAPNEDPAAVDTLAFTSTANSHPLPFKANIAYRSDERRRTAEQELAAFD